MKNIMVIIDGMGDELIEALDNKTPYEDANPYYMDYMKNNGAYGYLDTCPNGFNVNSLTCILTLLGVKREFIPDGRAYLEAISEDIDLSDDESIMRCNLVSIDENGDLASSTGGDINEDKCNELYKKVNDILDKTKFYMHHMSTYKNLLIIKNDKLHNIIDYPPHENIGKNFSSLIPKEEILQEFVNTSIKALEEEDNKYAYLPWGLSKKQRVPKFSEIHNMKGAAVCHTEIVRGIAIAMGMYTPKITRATADIDTDLEEKAKVALELLKDNDFVLVHINGADEASHRRNIKEKVDFIKRIDSILIKELMEKCKDTNILITSDHSTLCRTGEHKGDPQKFILYNSKLKGDIGSFDGKEVIKIMMSYD